MSTPERLAFHLEQTSEDLGNTIEELAAKADVKALAQQKAAEMKARARAKAAETAGTVREKTPPPLVAGVAAALVAALVVVQYTRRPRYRKIGPWKVEVRR